MSESTRERFRRLLGGGRRLKEPANNSEPPYQQTTLTQSKQPQQSDTPAPPQRPFRQTQPVAPPPAAAPPPHPAAPPAGAKPAQAQWPRSKSSTAPLRQPPEALPFIADDPTPNPDDFKTPGDARAFLERIREKTNHLIQDFARGAINQRQFQVVYGHYQQQRQAVEKALIDMPGSGAWRIAAVEGKTTLLRQQFAASLISYAIYETESGMPLAQMGNFTLDTALIVPMLSSFRSITQEIFGGGMRRTEIEGGRWLCFVPGECTTLIAIYQEEPASLQLQTVQDLHSDFERVYHMALERGADVQRMAQMFTRLWAPVTHCQSDKDG